MHYMMTEIVELKKMPEPFGDTLGYETFHGSGNWIDGSNIERKGLILGDLSNLEDWQQRLVAEKAQLDECIAKLSAFIVSDSLDELNLDDELLLREQEGLMKKLSGVLGKRIARFESPQEPQSEH